MQLVENARKTFAQVFGAEAEACGVAPGRVEVLGNHTDYNEGYILAAAIDRHVVICGRRCDGGKAEIFAGAYGERESFALNALKKQDNNFWVNYVQGVVGQLQELGLKIGGFQAVIDGDVPLGSGLSSSAALEVATLCLLKELYPFEMDRIDIALTCQRAENKFVGVNCGILDQFSSVMGKQDHLVFLDCRELRQYAHVPLGTQAELVLANTRAQHSLADGTYNRLRESCFVAAKYFAGRLDKKVTHLRDVLFEEFEKNIAGLGETEASRARHIVTENERVLRGVEALKAGDLKTMGECMLGSHYSSRDNFGNSCKELDIMVDCAQGLPGLYGSRLSGGGFGGCTVNLVEKSRAEEFAGLLAQRYEKETGIVPQMHVCRAGDGAHGVRF